MSPFYHLAFLGLIPNPKAPWLYSCACAACCLTTACALSRRSSARAQALIVVFRGTEPTNLINFRSSGRCVRRCIEGCSVLSILPTLLCCTHAA